MLHRVFGANGSGKSEYMLSKLKEAVAAGKDCFWIAPEQQSLAAEKRICEALGDRGTLKCEVLNFERLPNRIARSEGGLTDSYTDAGARNLLMSLSLIDNRKRLEYYGNTALDMQFVKSCVSFISRFKAEGITSDMLIQASEGATVSSDEKLKGKLKDLAGIMTGYDALLTGGATDPYDSLTKLYDRLEGSSFFNGCAVFVDGYYTFTYQEYLILSRIVTSCDDCYISFIADGRQMFADNRLAAERIARYCPRYEDIVMPCSIRGKSDALRHIEANLWENSYTPALPDASIKLATADNIFDECEFVASEVMKAVREGMRYRDISILMPAAKEYSEILESTLRRSDIPCFTSHKENVVSKPLFAFILSCLEVAYSDFSARSVSRYIKSGFSGLGVEESDLLLRYVEMWGINGQKSYDGPKWLMNPEGYDTMSRSGEKILAAINRAKQSLSELLSPLRDTLTQPGATVATVVKALYEHMVFLGVPEILESRAQQKASRGDNDGALREKQLMDIAVGILDKLYTLAGDRVIPLRQLCDIIESMANEYNVGSIPSSLDAVATGDPRLFRGDGSKLVIICGVNDGVFPSYSSGNLFFDEDELMRLEADGINLAVAGDAFIRRERFLFYMACTSPSHRLVLSYPSGEISGGKKRPSLGFMRIRELFPTATVVHFGSYESDFIYSLQTAASRYPSISDPSLKASVRELLEKNGVSVNDLSAPMFDADATIEYAKPREMGLSPSSFERYVYCPFSYFASRLMHLKKRERIEFAVAQTGTFIHKALEEYMRACTKNGAFLPMDDAQMRAEADRAVREYFPAAENKRYQRLCGSFRRTLNALYKNLNAEFGVCSFLPVGFEVQIGKALGCKKPFSVEVDGTEVYVRGTVDRVDRVELDGQKYIRITDYKTGHKVFSMDLIDQGLDAQMPMYLFSLCENDGAKPAGCTYYIAKLPYVERKAGETDAELERRIRKQISRSGIYSDNIPLIMAADNSADGLYRPVRLTSGGAIHGGDLGKVLSESGFDELKQKLGDKMRSVAEGIIRGNMSVRPKHIDQFHDACKYCDFRNACRYDGRR